MPPTAAIRPGMPLLHVSISFVLVIYLDEPVLYHSHTFGLPQGGGGGE